MSTSGRWVFEWEAPKGDRINRYFIWIKTWGENCWIKGYPGNWNNSAEGGSSDCHVCNTFKSFVRHLRKHPELRGQEVILVNRYIGYNVTAKWVEI